MEVQVLRPSPAVDFTYDTTSTSTTPYATAPSSPQSTIPFTWEQKPGIPKHQHPQNVTETETETVSDFAFGFLERHSISAADELFDGGKIKPLKPPPRLHHSNDSPKSPKSPKLAFVEALSPRRKKGELNHFDPFSEALKQTCGDQTQVDENENDPVRGRERSTKNNRCKVSRSLSPFRVADIVNNRKNPKDRSWYNKWNLKNLLLFRSASEGSATTRKKNQSFSFRSNRDDDTVAEEVRGKNTLRYKSGLMGCLRFNQNAASVREISRGINSVVKQ